MSEKERQFQLNIPIDSIESFLYHLSSKNFPANTFECISWYQFDMIGNWRQLSTIGLENRHALKEQKDCLKIYRSKKKKIGVLIKEFLIRPLCIENMNQMNRFRFWKHRLMWDLPKSNVDLWVLKIILSGFKVLKSSYFETLWYSVFPCYVLGDIPRKIQLTSNISLGGIKNTPQSTFKSNWY